ncbi:MAG: flagellar hook-basal body complex protein FliE [Campylobacteraceae bacterium]|nr:flagellar hook-basal body complex protein FliE [Campylobacteraceae bacterium]
MEISNISAFANINNQNLNVLSDNKVEGKSFDQLLKSAINDVNKSQLDGYDAMRGIASGNVPNLQEAVQKITTAESTLKLALEVKNKALGAYKEIMRMQV